MSGQMARFERAKERDRIRCEVDAIVNPPGAYSDDPLAAQWALVQLTAQGVLAICNLAETLEAANGGPDPAEVWGG